MAVVQEFDLDIKPAKLVKGQGLCKLAVEAQDQVNEDSRWENEIALWCGEVAYISPGRDSWYKDLAYLLYHRTCPEKYQPQREESPQIKIRAISPYKFGTLLDQL
jgi:hypothetical protein